MNGQAFQQVQAQAPPSRLAQLEDEVAACVAAQRALNNRVQVLRAELALLKLEVG